jgi:cell division protein FtsW
MIKYKKKSLKTDFGLLFLVIGLTLFGVLMVYNASLAEALRDFQDKYYYLKHQTGWLVLGLGLMLLFSFVNYRIWAKLAPVLFFINLIMLALVLIPGIGVQIKGARRWLDLGLFLFQPSELLKLTFSMYLSCWFVKKQSLANFLLLLGLVLGLIVLEPDMGTAVVVAVTGFLIYFVSGASILNLLPLSMAGFLLGIGVILISPYRKQRLLTFFDPAKDPLGTSYHIRQILIALGSGGLFGLGLGQSRQKYEYLPEATTDSIFAIIAEEVGFLGSFLLILALFVVVLKGLQIAKKAPDQFAKLLATGIAVWIGFQTLVNLGAMVLLIPLTGMPLPFISYGGSSLVLTLSAMGILLNISKYSEKKVLLARKKRKR